MQALMEAKRLLDLLEKQLPALSALDKGLRALAPHLRSAGQVLRKVEAQPESPGTWAGELEGVLRSLRAAASQLRAQGASGHSATVLKALTRIDALLTSFTKPTEQPSRPRSPMTGMPEVSSSSGVPVPSPPSSVSVAPTVERPASTHVPGTPSEREPKPLAADPADAPRQRAEPPLAFARPSAAVSPAANQEEFEPYDTLEGAHASGAPTASVMRWSVGALALASMERPPLPARKPPAPKHEASEEQEHQAPSKDLQRSAGLGPESTKAGRAQFSEELLALHLEHLSSAFNSRVALLSSGKATGSKLAMLEGAFLAHADALRWMGAGAIHALAERLESAEDAGCAFAMALPLLTLEGNDTVEAVQRVAQGAAPELAAGFVEALRFATHPRLSAVLEAFASSEAPAFLRAPALGLLVQAGSWESSLVQAALSSDEPELVGAAARAVLTAGRVELLGSLETLMTHELEAPADVDVLVAASVLGSSSALKRARARLAQEAAPPAELIRLMAACGVPEDSELLWRLGQKKGPVVKEALWALARLGTASSLPRMRELAEQEATSELASEPLRFLMGTVHQPPATGRVAQGAAWTAEVPVSVLMSLATPSAEREWAFWELAARTGLHVAIDVHWPWRRQQQAARAWEIGVKGLPHRLARGNWLYRGKLLAKGDGT